MSIQNTYRSPVQRQTYSVPEFAVIVGIAPRTAYLAAERGLIRAVRIGGRVVVPVAEVERLLAGKAEPAPPSHGDEPDQGDETV